MAARANGRVAAPKPSSADRDVFLALSSALTGFSPLELEGTGNVDAHLAWLWAQVGPEICGELLKAAGIALAQDGEADREQAIRASIWSSPCLGPVVQNLVCLWYTGAWNTLPATWQETYGWDKDRVASTATPPAQAYVESLVWTAIGAHPPGAKPPGYGSWSVPPEAAPAPITVTAASGGK